MAKMPIFVSVDGAQQLKDLNRRLKDAGAGDLRKELRQEIKAAGDPTLTALRAAVMGVDVSSTKGGRARPTGSTGLRRRTAKATKLSLTQTGIRIRVNGSRVDSEYPELVKYLDASLGRYDRWRHPVMGNRDVWTQQKGEPWFFVTIQKHIKDFRSGVFKAMEKIADRIAG